MKHREFQFPGCQDAVLQGQAWLPDRAARAVLVIAHGLGEHGGRYASLAERLVASGYAVYALDHRGHGRSSGLRADIGRFDYLVSDLAAFIGRAQREHPGTALILLGHSMGGAVALGCALKYHDVLRALVLSAPALATGDSVSGVKFALLKLVAAVAPKTGVLKLPASAVSRDPKVVVAYESDPLVFHGSVPARTAVELLAAIQRLEQQAHQLRIPVLIQHGSADTLVPLARTHPIYQRIGTAKQRSLQIYDGLYHEIYNEPERDRVIGDLERWLAG